MLGLPRSGITQEGALVSTASVEPKRAGVPRVGRRAETGRAEETNPHRAFGIQRRNSRARSHCLAQRLARSSRTAPPPREDRAYGRASPA